MEKFIKPRVLSKYVEDALDNLKKTPSVSDPAVLAFDAIAKDRDVLAAHRDLVKVVSRDDYEDEIYDPICVLGNTIMAALCSHAPRGTDRVLVFRHPSTEMLKGDYLYARFKPDIVKVVGTLKELREILDMEKEERDEYSQTGSPLQEVVGGQEIKTARKMKGQLFSYLACMKLHRPDLATIHGLQLEKKHLTLYAFNAGGVSSSGELPAGKLENWIAYVVLAYKALDEQDLAVRPIPQEAFVRWDLTLPSPLDGSTITIPLAPFQLGTAPGRSMWAAFHLDAEVQQLASNFATVITEAYHTKPPIGFAKFSWQDITGVFKEGELLDYAHGIVRDAKGVRNFENASWVPGLVRPMYYCRYDQPVVGLDGGVHRAKELLWLGSVGQPLSQCESLDHLYRVFFDILGILIHMAERGLIHRDASWYNLLCKPKHNPETLKLCSKIDHRPCIDFVLSDKKMEDCEPCALVTDLDHSAIIQVLESKDYRPRKERTGTPLFIALELAADWSIDLPLRVENLEALVQRFELLETMYPGPFRRAFPDGNTLFIRDLREVIAKLAGFKKDDPSLCLNITEPNRLHHDTEGVWWAMMWALLRAAPVDEHGNYIEMENYTDTNRVNYATRCNELLSHLPGAEDMRMYCLKDTRAFVIRHLHSKIKSPSNIVEEMASYLTVPWHLFVDRGDETRMVRRDHAHQAMRRLLLLAILERRNPIPDPIPISTTHPRKFDAQHHRDRLTSPPLNGLTGSGITQQLAQIAPVTAMLRRSDRKRSRPQANAPSTGDLDDTDSSDSGCDDPNDPDFKGPKRTNKKAKLEVDNAAARAEDIKDGFKVPVRPNENSVFDWMTKFHIDTVRWFGTGN